MFQQYTGRSVYNGLQFNYRQQVSHSALWGFIKPGSNLEVSYSFSRFVSNGGNDQNFGATAFDFINPGQFSGPAALDRTHQLSFGGVFDLKGGLRLSLLSHFYSSLPTNLFLEDDGSPGQIFKTDVTGDGTTGDIVPGTNVGSFMRGVSASGLNNLINGYNSSQAGTLTPAGQALVTAGLFTQDQLVALGAVKPALANAVPGELGNGILRTLDMSLSYPIKIKERFRLEPSIRFFNLFNFANFDVLTGTLALQGETPAPGSVQGTGTTADRDQVRLGNGSGTFSQGAPRQIEYGLRITF
jgi:hypothetical protein